MSASDDENTYSNNTPRLRIREMPQVAWYLQFKDSWPKSKKPLDKLPMAKIIELYEKGIILCDLCGKQSKISECNHSLVDHITHLINPNVVWSCEGCYLESKRTGQTLWEGIPHNE